MNDLFPSLAIGEIQLAFLKIHVSPLQQPDFSQACTGKNEQAKEADDKRAMGIFLFRFHQGLPQSRQLCVDSRTPSSIAKKCFSPCAFMPMITKAHNRCLSLIHISEPTRRTPISYA